MAAKKIEITAAQLSKNNKFLDAILSKQNLKNDAALSRALAVAPPVISKIRHGILPVGALMMIKVHELTGMLFAEIRNFIPKTA